MTFFQNERSGESNTLLQELIRHILFNVNYPGDRQRGGCQ